MGDANTAGASGMPWPAQARSIRDHCLARAIAIAQRSCLRIDLRLAFIATYQDRLATALELLGQDRPTAVEIAADLVAANALQLLDERMPEPAPDWRPLYWVD